jgi:hypothetical protein
LHILNHLCIPGMKPTWLCCMIIFICCWIHLPIFYWEFCIYVH